MRQDTGAACSSSAAYSPVPGNSPRRASRTVTVRPVDVGVGRREGAVPDALQQSLSW